MARGQGQSAFGAVPPDALHGNSIAGACQRERRHKSPTGQCRRVSRGINPCGGITHSRLRPWRQKTLRAGTPHRHRRARRRRGLYLTRGGNPLRVRNVFGSGGFTLSPAPRGPEPCGVVCFRRCGPSRYAARCLRKHSVLCLGLKRSDRLMGQACRPQPVVARAGHRPDGTSTFTARHGFVPRTRGAKGVEDHGDSVVCRESAVHDG